MLSLEFGGSISYITAGAGKAGWRYTADHEASRASTTGSQLSRRVHILNCSRCNQHGMPRQRKNVRVGSGKDWAASVTTGMHARPRRRKLFSFGRLHAHLYDMAGALNLLW